MNTILSSALLEIVISMAKHLYAKTINKTKRKKTTAVIHTRYTQNKCRSITLTIFTTITSGNIFTKKNNTRPHMIHVLLDKWDWYNLPTFMNGWF